MIVGEEKKNVERTRIAATPDLEFPRTTQKAARKGIVITTALCFARIDQLAGLRRRIHNERTRRWHLRSNSVLRGRRVQIRRLLQCRDWINFHSRR